MGYENVLDFLDGVVTVADKAGSAYNEFKSYDDQKDSQNVVLQMPPSISNPRKESMAANMMTDTPRTGAAQLIGGIDNTVLMVGAAGLVVLVMVLK